MYSADLDIPEMADSDIRSELDSIRSRMVLWRRLNELFTRIDGEVPLVQTTLERWVLHDQFADNAIHRSVEAPLRRQLYEELGKFDEQCGAVDRITDQMRADFDCAVTHLAQSWLVLADQHGDADFSAKELDWAKEEPAHAASWLWEGPVPPPRLGPLRKALEVREEALRAALDEPPSDDDDARSPDVAEIPPNLNTFPETARHSDVMAAAAPAQKRKLAAIGGEGEREGMSTRPKRTRANIIVDYREEVDDDIPKYSKGEPSPLIARRIESSGLRAGAIAQIPCDQCAIAKTECKLRFKANTGLPGACQRCHSKNSKCSGGDWRGQSRPAGSRDYDGADRPGMEELRREVAELRETVAELTSQVDAQNGLLVEQNQRLHEMRNMVEALLGIARSQQLQGRAGMK